MGQEFKFFSFKAQSFSEIPCQMNFHHATNSDIMSAFNGLAHSNGWDKDSTIAIGDDGDLVWVDGDLVARSNEGDRHPDFGLVKYELVDKS